MLLLLIVADIVVFFVLMAYIFKNIFSKYTLSGNGLRNLLIIGLICICAISSLAGILGTITTRRDEEEINYEVENGILNTDSQNYLDIKAEIEKEKKDSVTASIIEISSLVVLVGYHEPYKRKKAKEPSKGRWKLDSFK